MWKCCYVVLITLSGSYHAQSGSFPIPLSLLRTRRLPPCLDTNESDAVHLLAYHLSSQGVLTKPCSSGARAAAHQLQVPAAVTMYPPLQLRPHQRHPLVSQLTRASLLRQTQSRTPDSAVTGGLLLLLKCSRVTPQSQGITPRPLP